MFLLTLASRQRGEGTGLMMAAIATNYRAELPSYPTLQNVRWSWRVHHSAGSNQWHNMVQFIHIHWAGLLIVVLAKQQMRWRINCIFSRLRRLKLLYDAVFLKVSTKFRGQNTIRREHLIVHTCAFIIKNQWWHRYFKYGLSTWNRMIQGHQRIL